MTSIRPAIRHRNLFVLKVVGQALKSDSHNELRRWDKGGTNWVMGQEEWSGAGGQWSEKLGNKAIFKISETRTKYDGNSFRNGEFHVPLKGETRPERGRNER